MFIPAFLLLGVVALLQRRRQPAVAATASGA